MNAGLAGAFGVPVGLVTGDDQVCADAQRRPPGVVTAPVKEALDRFVGLSLGVKTAHDLIRERAREAMDAVRRGSVRPYRVEYGLRARLQTPLGNAHHRPGRLGGTAVASPPNRLRNRRAGYFRRLRVSFERTARTRSIPARLANARQ